MNIININSLSLDEINKTNKSTVLAAQQKLVNMIRENNELFVNSIRNNDLITAKNCDSWGLDWTDKKLWSNLLNFPSSTKITLDTFKYLENIEVNEIVPEPQSNYNYNKPVKVVVPQEVWNKKFITELERSFAYHRFSPEVIMYVTEQYPQFFISKDNKMNSTVRCLIDNFYPKNIADPKHDKIHEYLLNNHKEHLTHIFTLNLPIENFNYLLQNTQYNQVFQKFLTQCENNPKKTSVYQDCFVNGNVGLIKYWHENGFPFPEGKELYSHLFASVKNLGAIEYVSQNIEDITLNQQVILKTVLHYNLVNIVPIVLEQYSREQLEQLPLAIKGREPNEAVDKVQKFISYINLDNNLPTNEAIKRMKI